MTWGYVRPEWTGRGLPDDPGPADWFSRLALGFDPGLLFVLCVPPVRRPDGGRRVADVREGA